MDGLTYQVAVALAIVLIAAIIGLIFLPRELLGELPSPETFVGGFWEGPCRQPGGQPGGQPGSCAPQRAPATSTSAMLRWIDRTAA